MQDRGRASRSRSELLSAGLLPCHPAHRSGARASALPPLRRLVILAPALLGLVLGSPGCTTRADHPVVGPDSTLVYASKLPTDVNATILFQLKDSAVRDQAKRRDKERAREISRLQKERDRLLRLEERREKQTKLEAKRKAAAEQKAKKTKKGKKGKNHAQKGAETPEVSAGSDARRDVAAGIASDAPPPATATLPSVASVRDSLAAVESRLRALAAEDSLASIAPWKQKRPDGLPVDERAVETEEGARVQANIRLENVYARGQRPLTFHFVWLNPEKRKIFKRMLAYTPNDSVQVLASSLTISPTKRAPGLYTLQVFLFRELIAEKLIELRGTGHEEKEQGGDETM